MRELQRGTAKVSEGDCLARIDFHGSVVVQSFAETAQSSLTGPLDMRVAVAGESEENEKAAALSSIK